MFPPAIFIMSKRQFGRPSTPARAGPTGNREGKGGCCVEDGGPNSPEKRESHGVWNLRRMVKYRVTFRTIMICPWNREVLYGFYCSEIATELQNYKGGTRKVRTVTIKLHHGQNKMNNEAHQSRRK